MKTIKPFILLLSLSLTVCACEKDKAFELKPDGTEIDGSGTIEDEEKEPELKPDDSGIDDDGTKEDEEKEPELKPDDSGIDDDGTKEDEKNEFELKPGDSFNIKNGCGAVSYQSNIGKDFAAAVDSIKRFYEQNYPWLWADSIETSRLNVDFPYDNRLFWCLTAKEKYLPSPLPVYTGVDVVDSKGNHYKFWPCD